MADGRLGLAEPLHLVGIEEDAVGEPGPRIEPAALLEIVERTAAIHLLAEFVLVLGLGEMGVQAHVELVGKIRGGAHQRGRHRERRARRQRNLHHRIRTALVMFCHDARAVGEDRVLVLHDAIRRQAAVALRQVHRAARQQHAHAKPFCDADLDVDGLFEPRREDIMMIRRGGAAREQEFGHRNGDAELEPLRRQLRPHRIERLQPGKQLAVHRRGQRPRQRLIEMMMGVDEARQHDMLARIEHRDICGRRCSAGRHEFNDATIFNDDPAPGAVSEDGQGIPDPDRLCVAHDPVSPRPR